MARNKSNPDYEPHHKTSATGAVLQRTIYWPRANEWFEHVHADEPEENCFYSHPCNFNILRAKGIPAKKKGLGKDGHKRLPNRYLAGQNQDTQTL